jgi:hypothetical protein
VIDPEALRDIPLGYLISPQRGGLARRNFELDLEPEHCDVPVA